MPAKKKVLPKKKIVKKKEHDLTPDEAIQYGLALIYWGMSFKGGVQRDGPTDPPPPKPGGH